MIVFLLPPLVLALFFFCRKEYCLWGLQFNTLGDALNGLPGSPLGLFKPMAFYVCIGWLFFQVLLDRLLPGEIVEGVVLKDGSRLKYKMNGHMSFWVSFLVMGHCLPSFDEDGHFKGLGPLPLSMLYDMYAELALAAILISYALSAGVYLSSYRKGAKLVAANEIGLSVMYDFFIGRELNPRIGSLDLKCFCELRPGLIGWAVLNLGMACKQKENLGYISLSMVTVNLFQLLYVWDALFHERSILTTMDITTDGFGFMLAFGDLCWVPFVYTLQARFLVDHDPGLPAWYIAGVICLNVLGYIIFRGANGQKDIFRRNPDATAVAHLTWMQTQYGTKLLTSGWWGRARKINYTGDWIMGLSWCLVTGFSSPVPYFYSIYFGVLLVHRALRDDRACAAKYGADWAMYKKKVPSLFIPGII
ncbi:unnamed protein product [Discosporangium mesarthrocarpum]